MAEDSPVDEEPEEVSDEEEDLEGAPGAETFEATEREEREIAGEAARERSDFLSMMGHLYRGAMSQSTTWRVRLDRTSNWSVVVVASLLTFAFSTSGNPHVIILLGMLVVSLFLFIEARRYRFFDVWRSRVRLLEENVFANALEPAGAEQVGWRAILSEDLRRPKIKITFLEAAGRRLRRIYLALLAILLLAWVARLSMLVDGIARTIAAARLGVVPGEVVFTVVMGYFVLLVMLAVWPQEREAKGEMMYEDDTREWREKRTENHEDLEPGER